MSAECRIVVALHDAAPPFESDIRAQVGALQTIGVERFVIKVVPNWHGDHPISQSPSMQSLLAELEASGCQMVLHGETHEPRGRWLGPRSMKLRARLFAPSAAEFATLTSTETEDAIQRGLVEIAQAGLRRPDSFCAPAWLLTDDGKDALKNNGVRYVIGMTSIEDLVATQRTFVPALGFMGSGPAQEAGIGTVNVIMRAAAIRTKTLKVFLHPDRSGRQRWKATMHTVESMVREGWHPATYSDLRAP